MVSSGAIRSGYHDDALVRLDFGQGLLYNRFYLDRRLFLDDVYLCNLVDYHLLLLQRLDYLNDDVLHDDRIDQVLLLCRGHR